MQHGTKVSRVPLHADRDDCYFELRWIAHHFSRRGLIRKHKARRLRKYKRWYHRLWRRRGKRELMKEE